LGNIDRASKQQAKAEKDHESRGGQMRVLSLFDTQAYKMLGNGWTVEVIAHLLKATQAGIQAEEQLSLFGNGVI
jgi:hypothetical protein